MDFIQIKETCLYVQDLSKTEEFYKEKLSMPLISASEGRHVFFRVGSSVLLCFKASETEKESHLPPHGAFGRIHLAFEIAGEKYPGAKLDILGKGVEIIHEEIWPNGKRSFYFRDPDQHLLEVLEKGLWEK